MILTKNGLRDRIYCLVSSLYLCPASYAVLFETGPELDVDARSMKPDETEMNAKLEEHRQCENNTLEQTFWTCCMRQLKPA